MGTGVLTQRIHLANNQYIWTPLFDYQMRYLYLRLAFEDSVRDESRTPWRKSLLVRNSPHAIENAGFFSSICFNHLVGAVILETIYSFEPTVS
jgi:hypothetical protein